jgi:ATP-binding cassette subfamily B protein
LIFPYLIGKAIDTISPGVDYVDFGALGIIILALLSAYIIDAFIIFMQGWSMAGVSQRFIKNLRNIMFDKLQKLPIPFFDRFTHGEIMSRLANDMENISSTISQATIQLISVIITVTGSLTMMIILSPYLTIASLITLPLVLILTKTVTKRTKILFKNQQVLLGRLNGHIEETISGINVIKAYNHENKVISDFKNLNDNLCEVGVKAQIWSGFIMPLMNVINNIGFTAIAGFGGYLAIKGYLTIGTIAMFISYSRQFTRPLNEIANVYNVLQSAVAGAERVFEILNEPEEQEDIKDAAELKGVEGHVEFKNVNFGYRPDVPVLKNISFNVEAGNTIALVGTTGAGKTTIVNLLARFYDITDGQIMIDGKDIREYTRNSLRNCFGIVLQDAYLFAGSIKDNIRYGKLDAADQEITEAAKMANADVFINRLPDGFDTMISENGGNLSQGQKQLIALARVIL